MIKGIVSGIMLTLLLMSLCAIAQLPIFSKIITMSTPVSWREASAETTSASVMPPMKGMTVNAWSAEAYNSSDFDQSVANLANIGANWVTFTVFWFMEEYNDNEMHPRLDIYTASNASLIHAIQKAHELNMNVALKPMVDVVDGTWRGQIQPTNWALWFENYRNFINCYADFAEANNVELFEVGTELRSSQPYESEWRQVISEVRTHFSKNITYAANWDSYSSFATLPQYAINFWDALDYVGVDAYFPLTNSYSPTVEQLISAWSHSASGWWGTSRNWTNELYSTYIQSGKKIVFTEIGYCSQDGTNTQPWNWNISPTVDLQEQADCYQVALEVFRDKAWFAGWFWWSWETDPSAGGPTDKHYTPQNKPAENILNQYYHEVLHDIAVTGITCSKTIIGQGYSGHINITVENQGTHSETFNLTAYVNTTLIQTQRVALEEGNSTIVTFIWNTTSFVKGNYTVRAYAWPVLGETDTGDNNKTDGTVRVNMVGDIAPTFAVVNIVDVVKAAIAYDARKGDPNYDPNADIDGNDVINIVDIVIVAIHYGETDP